MVWHGRVMVGVVSDGCGESDRWGSRSMRMVAAADRFACMVGVERVRHVCVISRSQTGSVRSEGRVQLWRGDERCRSACGRVSACRVCDRTAAG